MQTLPAIVTLACLVAGASASQAKEDAGNPLGKVIELMDSLAAKITAEGEAHDKAYSEYYEWCEDFTRQKGFEIKTLTADKEKAEAIIEKKTADIDAGAAAIEELVAAIGNADKELQDAAAIREKEHSEFVTTETELVDAAGMLTRAIAVLEKEMQQSPAALVQVNTANMDSLVQSVSVVLDAAAFSTNDRTKLLALVQSQQPAEDADDDMGAPAAAAYKSKSGSIVDVLEDMKEKAEAELADARKAEATARHNFEMLAQSLKDRKAADEKDLAEEKANKSAAEEAKAVAEGERDMAGKALAEAEKALQEEREGCMQVARDHDVTLAGRAAELKAIATAKKILQESTTGAVEQTYSLLQLSTRSTLRATQQRRAALGNVQIIGLVKKLADTHHSMALAQLASQIQTVLKLGGEDPFGKVKSLITSMIEKLMKEAAEEAEEKAYCDEEMGKTEAKKSELQDSINKLTAKIDQAAAASARLKEEVKTLEGELAALFKLQSEMDKAREAEHAHYVEAKADLEAGLGGVRAALDVLKEYYASKEEDSAALLQSAGSMSIMVQQPAVPENHAPAEGAGGGIISILEVCESDFAKNLAQEESEESDAQEEYDKMTQENKVTTVEKQQDAKYKRQESTALDESVAAHSSDRDTAQTELSAVLEYYAKLKDRCVAKPETYEERKKRREAEIAGLKSALSILEGEAVFMQQPHRTLRGIRPVLQ